MSLSIVVANDLNNGIGYNNQLLYHIKEDLQRFKEITLNHKVVMGRKTFESLPKKEPLKNRTNIVITRDSNNFLNKYKYDNLTCMSIEKILELYKDIEEEIFIIGGETIYNIFLPYVEKIYLTRIYKDNDKPDAFFKIPYDEFQYESICPLLKDDNDIFYKFIILTRDHRKNI